MWWSAKRGWKSKSGFIHTVKDEVWVTNLLKLVQLGTWDVEYTDEILVQILGDEGQETPLVRR